MWKNGSLSIFASTVVILGFIVVELYNFQKVPVYHMMEPGIKITEINDSELPTFPLLVVVTGISSNHFMEVLDMIGSVHHFLPNTKIILYDLGLHENQLQLIYALKNVEVRNYDFSKYPNFRGGPGLGGYTFKVHIINEISKQYHLFLWLDSSVRILQPLTNGFLQRLSRFPLAAGKRHVPGKYIVAFTLDSSLKYLNITREDMRDVVGFESGILLFRMNNITRYLIDHWVDCALHIECMHGIIGNFEHIKCNWSVPKSIAYNGCHRYDQATINLLTVKYFGKKRADEIAEDGKNKTFNVHRAPSAKWISYIKWKPHSLHYNITDMLRGSSNK